MAEDNQQLTSRSRRLTSTARFHSGHSQEATTPAGRTSTNMIEDSTALKLNVQALPSSMRHRDSKVDKNSIHKSLTSGLGMLSDDEDSINQRA